MLYRLYKTNQYVNMAGIGERVVYYSPDLDLCFIKAKGWLQIDTSKTWDRIKETNHVIEWR